MVDTPRGKQLKNLLRATGPVSGFNGAVFRTKHGYSKFHYRPAPAGYNVEIKSEPNMASGTFFGLINTVDHIPTSSSTTGLVANGGICRLASGYTMTNGSLAGTYSQIKISGTLNGGNIILAAHYGLIEASPGNLTVVGHMAVSWLDSHLVSAPSSGTLSFEYITNNGAATFENVWYIYAANKISNLFTIEHTTDTNLVGDNINSDFTFQNYRKITVTLGGETYYLIADKGG